MQEKTVFSPACMTLSGEFRAADGYPYGQIAWMLGTPRAARQVGWATQVPGRASVAAGDQIRRLHRGRRVCGASQSALLEAEGVPFLPTAVSTSPGLPVERRRIKTSGPPVIVGSPLFQ